MRVFVLTGETGSYSDTRWWVVAVFRDREQACGHRREALEEWIRVAQVGRPLPHYLRESEKREPIAGCALFEAERDGEIVDVATSLVTLDPNGLSLADIDSGDTIIRGLPEYGKPQLAINGDEDVLQACGVRYGIDEVEMPDAAD